MRNTPAYSWRGRPSGTLSAVVAAAGLMLAACADVAGPTSSTHAVEAYVFYDEDGDLALDAAELARVPGVDVTLGGRTGRSEPRTGRVLIADVPEGEQSVAVRQLPPYYAQKAIFSVRVPVAAAVCVPLQLDIGSNRPNVYVAFGDSITDGTGSSDGLGYRKMLQSGLASYFGAGTVENEGVAGTRTAKALARVGDALAAHHPAYTLILYGTNDWNDSTCHRGDTACQTVEHLRDIVRAARSAGSLPILGTILPCNPARVVECPSARNVWVDETNKALRAMAQSEAVPVADLHAAFAAQPDLATLFSDHVHPNDAGYRILADEFLRAVTGDATATTSAGLATTSGPGRPFEPFLRSHAPAPASDSISGSAW
jgi:acyl-CoA thioesterase-1